MSVESFEQRLMDKCANSEENATVLRSTLLNGLSSDGRILSEDEIKAI